MCEVDASAQMIAAAAAAAVSAVPQDGRKSSFLPSGPSGWLRKSKHSLKQSGGLVGCGHVVICIECHFSPHGFCLAWLRKSKHSLRQSGGLASLH
jgi:hypothetical protein